ncbi:flagellar protein FlaG [Halomonas daqiaonensis]|uniref:Flagellar protein FlaG n=1 Tax=Halomonas daqiaonensis TaxID=650850 RepID=A0A1H7NZK7_9GAMM|nr:flagellar protein FlaG [Halomonas daqiaonensis]SEL28478.1 flagellar protein FlaG [Halomonas daqiaonensis]
MTSPLTDATSSPQASPFSSLTAHQRLESMLGNLPPPGGVVAQGASGAEPISKDALVEPTRRINEVLRPYGLEFELSEETSRLITRIVDRDNGEVIRQIPAEEVLKISERMEELQGLLIRLEA